MARLTTHVLDTTRGAPGAGMRIHRCALDGGGCRLLRTVFRNDDGRTAEPLICGDRIEPGIYELAFGVGECFGPSGVDPPFLGEVTVRFGVAGPLENYHVPLLIAP